MRQPLLPAVFHPSHRRWLRTKAAMMGMEGGCASELSGTLGPGEPWHAGLGPPSHPTVLGVIGWTGGLGDPALTTHRLATGTPGRGCFQIPVTHLVSPSGSAANDACRPARKERKLFSSSSGQLN